MNFIIGLLDGIGLMMFVPLLAFATNTRYGDGSLGDIEKVFRFLSEHGFELTLNSGLLLMVSTFVLKGALQYIRGIYFAWLQQKLMLRARLDLINRFGKIGYEGYTKLEAGRIQGTLTGDVSNVVYAMTNYFSVFQDAIMVVAYVGLACLANWQFAIVVMIGAYFTNFIYDYVNRVTKEIATKNKFLGFNFGGDLIQIVNNFKYL
ncbi:MAG: hypothetical protein LBV31_00285, partial [Prevotellaceae bacterium]|nr:hypothetical protein [Prevotellaceae bacterium]